VDGNPEHTGDGWDDEIDAPPPLPRAARVIRALALGAVMVAVLIGVVGVWRAQTNQVLQDKSAERRAHERAYSQLAGDPAGPGAARVQNITVTDARIDRAVGSAAGSLYLTVYNSAEPVRLESVHVMVGTAQVSRVLYAAKPGADPEPLPRDGIVLDRSTELVFAPDGPSFALIGLPATTPGQRAKVTVVVSGLGQVRFEAPVRDTGVSRP
jgi:hypothetical protein